MSLTSTLSRTFLNLIFKKLYLGQFKSALPQIWNLSSRESRKWRIQDGRIQDGQIQDGPIQDGRIQDGRKQIFGATNSEGKIYINILPKTQLLI